MLTPNQINLFRDRISWKNDIKQQLIVDHFYDNLPELFEAIILSGLPEQSNSPNVGAVTQADIQEINDNRYYFIRIRPMFTTELIIPNPFYAANLEEAKRLINMHPLAYIEVNNSVHPPTHGDVYSCRYIRKDKLGITLVARKRSSGLKIGKIANRNLHKAYNNVSPMMLGANSLMGSSPSLSVPVLEGDITPISTWTATPENSKKEDSSFTKGNCPNALTGVFRNLPRKHTTFYKYKKDQVVRAITRSGQPAYIQRTMYVFIKKEQGKFSFPNNNVAGIQTDGGLFTGTTLADYDYQTCYKDAKTWRAFAGFNSLDKGMMMFGKAIAGKYSRKFREPIGNYEQQADQLVWNYYASWNISLNPTQLEELKRTGQTTKRGKVIEKTWSPNVKSFAGWLKEFDNIIGSS